MQPVRVVLVGRDRVFVGALASWLAATSDVELVGAVMTPAAVTAAVRQGGVDVVVVDLDLDVSDVLTIADVLRGTEPRTGMVVVGEGDVEAQATAAIAAGCSGWVSVADGLAGLADTVVGVHRGETRVPVGMLVHAVHQLHLRDRLPTPQDRRLAALSPRERQVLDLLAAGCPREEVAVRLRISANTVRTHQQHVLAKLGVHTTLAAVTLLQDASARIAVEPAPRRVPAVAVPS